MARAAYDDLRKLGLTHEQVMKRMSAKDRAATYRADYRQAMGDFSGGNTYKAGTLDSPTAPEDTPAIPPYVDPRGNRPSDRDAYLVPPTYVDPRGNRPSDRKPPTQVVAEFGDDFSTLADKLGIDAGDLAKANKNTNKVSAGASYNVPALPPGVGYGAGANEQGLIPWGGPGDKYATFYEWANAQPGGNLGGGIPNMLGNAAEAIGGAARGVGGWLGDLFGTDGSQVGIGVGGTYGLGGIQSPPPSLPAGQAEYADFRQAEANAAYKDREIAAMTGTLGITDIKDRDGYYGFYGTEQDLANKAQGDFSQLYNPLYNPTDVQDPRDNRPSQRDSYLGGNAANVAALEEMWNDTYLNPENKGRGGGIVGWIEERTGLTIDPETFFTEGASEEVLAAMLAEFGQDELNYLESHGILVAEDGYPLGGGGYGGGNYNYPAVSYQTGGRSSGPSQAYQRQSNVGLVVWSI